MIRAKQMIYFFRSSFLAALLYIMGFSWFIHAADFTASWRLYIGNFLFALGILFFIRKYKHNPQKPEKATGKIFAGHIVTIGGIVLACIMILIILWLLIPHVFNVPAEGVTLLKNKPAQMQDKTQGLIFLIFMNTIIGNVCAGSFISILFSVVFAEHRKSY